MPRRTAAGNDDEDGDASGNTSLLDRRSYLLLAGAAASTVATGSAVAAAGTTRHGISFDRRVDLVEDFGADPTGSEPVDAAIADAMRAGTLVEVPAGTYKLTSTVDVPSDRIGFLATGDARFVIPGGFVDAFLRVEGPDEFLFEGIDIEHQRGSAGHMRLHCPSTFHVQDVTYHGRGANAGYAFNIALTDASGVGRLKNVRVPHGADPSVYGDGNGRIGLWAGFRHKGTLRFENSELSEFGNNGIYSRCPGNIQVVDSYFSNNNVASVRIAGKGSFVENSTIVIDFSEYDGPFSSPNEAFGPAGVVFDNKKPDLQSAQLPPKGYPGEVRGSRIELRNVPDSVTENRGASGCVDIWGTTRAVRIDDSDLRVDIDDVEAVVREYPHGRGDYRSDMSNPPEPHWVELDDVRITGTADGREAVFVDGADGTSITNTDIQQSGSDRDGVRFVDTTDATVSDSNIDVSGTAITTKNSDVTTNNITSDSTTDPTDGSGSDSTDGSGSDSTDGSTTEFDHDLRVMAADGADAFSYELVTSGSAELVTSGEYAATAADGGRGETVTQNADGTYTISGVVAGGGGDAFRFDGELLDGSLGGDGSVYVDGQVTDVATLAFDHDLRVMAADGADAFSYELTTSGPAELVTSGEYASTAADGGRGETVTQNADGTYTISGIVADGGGDAFQFDGELLDASLDGSGTVYVDGQQVATGSQQREREFDHDLRVMAADGADVFTYELTTSGPAELVTSGEYASTAADGGRGETVTQNADGTYTIGGVVAGGGGDAFQFDGRLLDVGLGGPATVYVDGEQVDPDEVGVSRTLRIEPTTTERAAYEVTVSDGLLSDPDVGSFDESDSLSGNTATGTVSGSSDGYLFGGTIDAFSLDGPAAVYVDGEQVEPTELGTDADPVLENRIVIDGQGSETTYEFSVTGDIEKSPDLGSVETDDEVANGTVSGAVVDDVDGYRFSGDLSISRIDGAVDIEFADMDG